MDLTILSHINYWAVAVSAMSSFFVGAIWFSPVLFSNIWVDELRRHNVIIHKPSSHKFLASMILTFLKDIIVALALACLIYMTSSTTFATGLTLGLIVACGFSATAIGGVFIWENRSIKLFCIDAGYQMMGVILSALILSVWR